MIQINPAAIYPGGIVGKNTLACCDIIGHVSAASQISRASICIKFAVPHYSKITEPTAAAGVSNGSVIIY